MTALEEIKDYLLKELKAEFSVNEQVNCFKVSKDNYWKAAKYLQEQKFQRMLTISAIDWIEKDLFSVYFIVHKFPENIYVKVETEIPRTEPKITSIHELWPTAGLKERETWEMFQITFEGNDDLRPLFLEEEPEIAPFRKEFDWREFYKASLTEK
ncbi:MAG: NADH-quinone oxidoreductase subunit C [Candidatus Heimdallarchaeota archaeon]|nr:MAG: NADH-quinone oxidoreductase subunit C [Candidatus Gerdarchaeota archaeon]